MTSVIHKSVEVKEENNVILRHFNAMPVEDRVVLQRQVDFMMPYLRNFGERSAKELLYKLGQFLNAVDPERTVEKERTADEHIYG